MTAPMTPERKMQIRAKHAGRVSYLEGTADLDCAELLAEVDRLEAELERVRIEDEKTCEKLAAARADTDAACRAFGVRALWEAERRINHRYSELHLQHLIAQIERGEWPPKSKST